MFNQVTDNVWQGSYPESLNQGIDFDVIVNVSDCPHGSLNNNVLFYKQPLHFWFPILECSIWSYSVFYAVKRVLDQYRDKKTLVHCCSGVCRSVLVTYGWLVSNDEEHLWAKKKTTWDRFINHHPKYTKDVIINCPPPYLVEFLKMINKCPSTYSVGGVLSVLWKGNDESKNKTIFEFLKGKI